VATLALATRNTELYGNRTFDAEAILAMRPSLQPMAWPWLTVHEVAQERGHTMCTADQVADTADVKLIAYDWNPDAERLIARGAHASALVSFEPPVIAWQLYADLPRISARFAHTIWFAGARSRALGRFHQLHFPQRCPPVEQARLPWGERHFLVMINSNKVLARAWQLDRWLERPREVSLKRELAAVRFPAIGHDQYRARLAAIDAFADRPDFDLYGEGWQTRHAGVSARQHARALRAYRGSIDDKLALLASYRFALALENTRFAGYVSEKLFDCLVAGCIPVYDGAPDVAQYVWPDAFVDARAFGSYVELERHLRGMTEADWRRAREAGQAYLRSPDFERFCARTFATLLLDAVE
jgi:hypothetical protein